jgi:hypothetical protein
MVPADSDSDSPQAGNAAVGLGVDSPLPVRIFVKGAAVRAERDYAGDDLGQFRLAKLGRSTLLLHFQSTLPRESKKPADAN